VGPVPDGRRRYRTESADGDHEEPHQIVSYICRDIEHRVACSCTTGSTGSSFPIGGRVLRAGAGYRASRVGKPVGTLALMTYPVRKHHHGFPSLPSNALHTLDPLEPDGRMQPQRYVALLSAARHTDLL